jgi:hypothetical protein
MVRCFRALGVRLAFEIAASVVSTFRVQLQLDFGGGKTGPRRLVFWASRWLHRKLDRVAITSQANSVSTSMRCDQESSCSPRYFGSHSVCLSAIAALIEGESEDGIVLISEMLRTFVGQGLSQ